MNKPIPIHWKELPGNKFNRRLVFNMLTPRKYHVQMRLLLPSETEKQIYLVEYDKEYVLDWLVKKVLAPFAHLEEEQVIQLIKEAYSHEPTE